MQRRQNVFTKFAGAIVLLTVFIAAWTGVSRAQQLRSNRIPGPVDDRVRTVIRGNVQPLARIEFDQGRVDPRRLLHRITIDFKPTAAQQADLNALLQAQQDPASPDYHKWLTPEEFADRFGMNAADLETVSSWLGGQGFRIDEVGRARSWIAFSGTAGQAESAFNTELHEYLVDGVRHFAPAVEPSVPAALGNVVSGFSGLHDFRMQPRLRARRARFTSNLTGSHFLAPDDVATIYDIHSLYSSGIDGTGQTIAVMGQTDILMSDIATFRLNAGLPANSPTVILVPGSGDPGISENDLPEADLDLEWSGAIAPKASLIYVNSGNGAFDSLQYAIDKQLAPVVSISYGDCEPNFSTSEIDLLVSLGQQANAQGMTILAPSGDAGATDCDGDFSNRQLAQLGLNVDLPGSLPYSTSVGGTTLFDVAGNYWSASNNGNNGSAVSYIPEVPWNDTLVFAVQGLAGGGGGKSVSFSKPSWQAAAGVPNDGARDVPDISLSASDYDGYLICSGGSCVNGFRASDSTLFVVSGTSATTQEFAGIVALLNQRMGTPQGNVNTGMYKLAQTAPTAFHDITTGGNWMPCKAGSLNCPGGGLIGYSAGRGYDLVTGIGSIDAFKLVTEWPMP